MIIIECCISVVSSVLSYQIGHQISGSEVALCFILSPGLCRNLCQGSVCGLKLCIQKKDKPCQVCLIPQVDHWLPVFLYRWQWLPCGVPPAHQKPTEDPSIIEWPHLLHHYHICCCYWPPEGHPLQSVISPGSLCLWDPEECRQDYGWSLWPWTHILGDSSSGRRLQSIETKASHYKSSFPPLQLTSSIRPDTATDTKLSHHHSLDLANLCM